jgi:hypothetical protein
MKKMTKKEMFNQILTHLTDVEEIAFINHEIELLERKHNGGNKAPTKTQVENGNLKQAILNYMDTSSIYTVSDLQTLVPELRGLTNQKVNSLVTQLKNDNLVSREYIKRVAYFHKV